MEPSARICPLLMSMAFTDAFMTKYAITADNAATSFSLFAIPMAHPTAKIIGRLSKRALPALLKTVKNIWRMVPSPKIACKP